jgi:hypothetical protein
MLYCLMAVTRFVFFILLSCGVLGAEEIPQLKAKAGMPVIQELVGGCSLTCARYCQWASASGERFQGIWPHQEDPTLPQ